MNQPTKHSANCPILLLTVRCISSKQIVSMKCVLSLPVTCNKATSRPATVAKIHPFNLLPTPVIVLSNMTTNFYHTFIASGLLLLSYACSPTKDIHQGLTRHPASLAYLYDTPAARQQSSLSVGLQSVEVTPLPPTGQLEETKKSVLPLLVYNSWKHEFIYNLGQASVAGGYECLCPG